MLRGVEIRLDRCHDPLSNLILHRENVADVPVITFRPHVGAALGLDQLGTDAHAVRSFADATFQNVAHAKLSAYLLYVHCPAPIDEARVTGDHEQPTDT